MAKEAAKEARGESYWQHKENIKKCFEDLLESSPGKKIFSEATNGIQGNSS